MNAPAPTTARDAGFFTDTLATRDPELFGGDAQGAGSSAP